VTGKKEKFVFDGYRLDGASRELRHGDTLVEIEPKVFDLLIYLTANHDRAVDKDELLAAVWPGLVITETALTRAVMKARKAVGDDATRQAVIKTVHGHGYRFVAELQEFDEVAPASPAPAVSRSTSWRNVAIGLALAALLAIAWWTLKSPVAETGGTRLAVLPLAVGSDDPELAWLRLGLMSYVSRSLAAEDAVEVLSDGSVAELAERFGWSGELDEDNSELLNRLTTVFGVTHVLAMQLQPEGKAWRMNYALREPGGTIQRGTMVGDQGTDLAGGVVQAMYGLLFHRSRQNQDIQLVSRDPFNNEAFARGMSLSIEGRCTEAVQYFQVIVDQEPDLFEPRYQLASCLRQMGENDPAEILLVELVANQSELGPSRDLARSWLLLGILYNRTGRMADARAAYGAALDLARELDDADLEARSLHNLAILHEDLNQLDRADEYMNLAMLAYQRAGREVLPGQLWSTRANIKMARGDLDGAELDLEKALAAFREVGDRRSEAMMLNNTGYLRRRQGRLEEAESYHLRSLEIREEIRDRVGQGRIWTMLGGVYTAQGRYEEAEEAAQAALEIARESNDRLFEATSLATLADAERSLGKTAQAGAHYRQSRDILAEIQDTGREMQVDLRLAQLSLEAGDAAEARRVAERVLERARASDALQAEVQALEKLGDIAHDTGDVQSAADYWQAAMERLEATSWGAKINALAARLAEAWMDLGEPERAAPLVGLLAGDEPNVPSLKTQARFAFESGDPARAIDLMQAAKERAGTHWSPASEAALESYLAAAGPK
jgi:DNA-binding winged helix-turn-helix (wHTH) protein/tetratricopeptide (TPR) repeat protein